MLRTPNIRDLRRLVPVLVPSESYSTQDSMSTVENDSLTTHDHPGKRKKRMNPVDVEILKISQSSIKVQKSNSPETK
ncbi:unnamed protein product [Pieris macdunnoughi]|uniref:Uncharacterized protein n=1 Tax=Pieris macdunnoughi TaxID=345717 RepID=A0A821UK09_9NEOP|nr:unnamed protein product [Pieris macdunnoughi]